MRYRDLLLIPNVRWLAVARFMTSVCFYSSVIVAFETSRGLNYTGIFAMEAILSLAMFAFEVPTGVWADRFGHRRMVVLGYGLELAGNLLMAFSWGFWMFALSTFLFGIGMACISGCESAMLYESLPKERREALGAKAFALLNSAGSAGFFCGLAGQEFPSSGLARLPQSPWLCRWGSGSWPPGPMGSLAASVPWHWRVSCQERPMWRLRTYRARLLPACSWPR